MISHGQCRSVGLALLAISDDSLLIGDYPLHLLDHLHPISVLSKVIFQLVNGVCGLYIDQPSHHPQILLFNLFLFFIFQISLDRYRL